MRIGEHKWNAVGQQIEKHGRRESGVWRLNTDLWDDAGLRDVAKAAMKKDADSIIVTPKVGDKVNRLGGFDFQHPLGRLVLQFKSFFISASQKLTLRMAQDPDRGATASTFLMMAAIGMAVDEIKAWSGGYDVPDNLGARVASGLDRAGILSIWMELNNMAESVNVPGVYAGATAPFGGQNIKSSRYRSRNTVGSLAGPAAGMFTDAVISAGDVLGEARGIGEGVTPATVNRLKNITPYHNLPLIRELVNLWAMPRLKEAVE